MSRARDYDTMMTLGLRSTFTRLATLTTLSLSLAGCILGEAGDDTAGGSTGGPGGHASDSDSPCTEGPGATSGVYSSGWEPCGTGGCEASWSDGGYTSGASGGNPTTGATSGATWGWDTDSDGDPGPGPLITTGNEDATEWDVTARHTYTGQPPEQGTYLTTTIIYMETDFHGVVEIPHGSGASYAWIDGDHMAGSVTIVQGGIASFDIGIEGTLQMSDTDLDGSGTFHDQNTGAPLGTWEILDAIPRS